VIEEEQDPAACPDCKTPTRTLMLRYGTRTEFKPAYCRSCTQKRVREARAALRRCHCAEIEGEHTHGG
jgi:hypothetical protein